MLRYHPERYRRTRPFSKKIMSLYNNTVGINPPTSQYLDEVSNIIFETYNNELSLLPVESRPEEARMVMREPSIPSYYGAYCAYGRNIFHLEDEILEEFLHTDVGSVPVGLIKYPFDCFYISFGSIKSLTLYNGKFQVDGAYVFAFEGYPLQIALTTSIINRDYSNRHEWILNPDRYYYMAMDNTDPSATFEILIKKALKKELEAQVDKGNIPETGIYKNNERSIGVINKRPESSKKDNKEILSGFETFETALNLVVNTLCYISQYKNEIKEEWPSETPKSLLLKLKATKTPKQKQRVISKLTSMGYTKVKVCGSSFKRNELSTEEGNIETHWRRGHWRQQPYGEDLNQVKVIWIRPTIVRKDKGNPTTGHIYEFSKTDQN